MGRTVSAGIASSFCGILWSLLGSSLYPNQHSLHLNLCTVHLMKRSDAVCSHAAGTLRPSGRGADILGLRDSKTKNTYLTTRLPALQGCSRPAVWPSSPGPCAPSAHLELLLQGDAERLPVVTFLSPASKPHEKTSTSKKKNNHSSKVKFRKKACVVFWSHASPPIPTVSLCR